MRAVRVAKHRGLRVKPVEFCDPIKEPTDLICRISAFDMWLQRVCQITQPVAMPLIGHERFEIQLKGVPVAKQDRVGGFPRFAPLGRRSQKSVGCFAKCTGHFEFIHASRADRERSKVKLVLPELVWGLGEDVVLIAAHCLLLTAGLFPAEQTRIVKLLVEKVIVSPNDLEVRLRANGIERLVLELRPEPVEQQAEALA
jgi:hypothetical protein